MKRNFLISILALLLTASLVWAAGFDGNNLFFKNSSGVDYKVTPPGSATTMVGTTTTQTLTNKTLTSPTITGATLSSPTINSATMNTVTSTAGTFTSPTINSATINTATVTGSTLTTATLTTPVIAAIYQDASKTQLMTLPNTASDTLSAIAATQTLTNKTLTTPVIASIYQNTGKTQLMTLPDTASDTLAAIAATQTLTNKTLTTPTVNGMLFTYTSSAYTTTSSNLSSSDSGKLISNSGASAEVTVTLPEASTVIGKPFIFTVAAIQTFNVDVQAADQIVPTTNAAGDKVWADALGESIILVAVDNTYFVELSKTGTWSDGD